MVQQIALILEIFVDQPLGDAGGGRDLGMVRDSKVRSSSRVRMALMIFSLPGGLLAGWVSMGVNKYYYLS